MTFLATALALFLTSLPTPSIAPKCKMIGLINPLTNFTILGIDTQENSCFRDSNTTIKSCCSKDLAGRINSCWKLVSEKANERVNQTYDLIKAIHTQENVEALYAYFRPPKSLNLPPTTERRDLGQDYNDYGHLMELLESNIQEINSIQNLEKELSGYGIHPKRRILGASDAQWATERIQSAKDDLEKSIKNEDFRQNMAAMYRKEANQCWNHYYNVIQKGILCSFCLDDSNEDYFGVLEKQISFTYASCDKFIPRCLKMSIIQTELSTFFRNVLVLVLNKLFKGTMLVDKISSFIIAYETEKFSLLVRQCKKNAQCDQLCNQTIKFGDFSNEYIVGDIYLLDRFKTFLYELRDVYDDGKPRDKDLVRDSKYWAGETLNPETNNTIPPENLFNHENEKVNAKWVDEQIVKVITLKSYQ